MKLTPIKYFMQETGKTAEQVTEQEILAISIITEWAMRREAEYIEASHKRTLENINEVFKTKNQ